jgi:hypothetical protein
VGGGEDWKMTPSRSLFTFNSPKMDVTDGNLVKILTEIEYAGYITDNRICDIVQTRAIGIALIRYLTSGRYRMLTSSLVDGKRRYMFSEYYRKTHVPIFRAPPDIKPKKYPKVELND